MAAFEPIITSRLTLRPLRHADAVAISARRSDPDVARYQSYAGPYPIDRAAQMVAEVVAFDRPVPEEWWMVAIARDGDTDSIGTVAVYATFDGRVVELGWELSADAWGKGYASEAVEAMVAWLFDATTVLGESGPVQRIGAQMHPDNLASARVAESVGMRYEGLTRGSYFVGDVCSDDLLYGMTRDD